MMAQVICEGIDGIVTLASYLTAQCYMQVPLIICVQS